MTRPLVRSLACVTIATARPDALADMVVRTLDWRVADDDRVGAELAAAWGVEDVAGRRSILLVSEASARGALRVIEGRERWPLRPIGARWSGAEVLVTREIDDLHDRLGREPDYLPLTQPDNADFTEVGANVHRFFHGRFPGGTHLMFTAAVTAARDYDFPSGDARVGHVFSVPLVSSDFASERRFLENRLGLVSVLDDRLHDGIWHRTWRLPAGTPVELTILKGDAPGFGEGGIELQGYPVDVIDPLPGDRVRLDGGACLATFVTDDLDAAYAALSQGPGVTCGMPHAIEQAPYGGARSFAVLTPGGARIEITERFGQA